VPEETHTNCPKREKTVCDEPMRDLEKAVAKTATQTKVNLRKAGLGD